MLNEFETIALLSRELGTSAKHVCVGIGDDAAVLRADAKLVWSVDTALEGRHFDLRWLGVEQAATRAFVAAVSDLAAMAARPLGALSAIVVPGAQEEATIAQLAKAQARVAAQYGCPILGGNITAGPHWEFTTTVLGSAERPLLRSGARSGDELWLVGDVGAAAVGLKSLQAGREAPRSAAMEHCVRAWREPVAQTEAALALVPSATAGIDVSDGLAADAQHLARASRVSVVIEEPALRRSLSVEMISSCEQLGLDPVQQALRGGEDYALLIACGAGSRPGSGHRVGRVESRAALAATAQAEVFLERTRPNGSVFVVAIATDGYDHLAPDR